MGFSEFFIPKRPSRQFLRRGMAKKPREIENRTTPNKTKGRTFWSFLYLCNDETIWFRNLNQRVMPSSSNVKKNLRRDKKGLILLLTEPKRLFQKQFFFGLRENQFSLYNHESNECNEKTEIAEALGCILFAKS